MNLLNHSFVLVRASMRIARPVALVSGSNERTDTVWRPSYDGPFEVIKGLSDHFVIKKNLFRQADRPELQAQDHAHISRIKPAFIVEPRI